LILIACTAAALPVAGVLILVVGGNPVKAYIALLVGAFGSARAWTEIILLATPLLLIGLGLALAFRCKIWNIGAEGQYLVGALCATWIGLTWGDTLPGIVILPLMFLAGALGGALWGFIPGILKARLGLSEIVISLMLNYVALYGLAYLVRSPLKNPEYYLPQTAPLPEAARLPRLFGSRLHLGVLIGLGAVFLVYFVLWRTTFGYELRAVGANLKAAEAAGINVPRSIVLVMVLSGVFAGLAGTVEVAGVHYHLSQGVSAGFGYTAVLIAILGRSNPYGVLFAGFLFSSLVIGADYMHRSANLQQALVEFIQATVVLFFLIGTVVAKRRE
jgi:simple sugar transport system permease protein